MTTELTTTQENPFDKGYYSSLKLETKEDKKRMYNALESCDNLLNNCVGQEINLKDIYIESYNQTDDNGDSHAKYRTILFDDQGTSYVTTAYGVYNALRKIVSIYGEPTTWSEPLKVQVIKRPIGKGRETLTLVIL